MQKPPDRRPPMILFTRATSEWINRVSQKHKMLTELDLSVADIERLDRWAEAEFVYAALKLEGVEITQDQVEKAESALSAGNETTERGQAVIALIRSLRLVASVARAGGKAAELNSDLLLKLHNAPGAAAGFRKSTGASAGRRKVANPEVLSLMLETACQWYAAESFTELNPVEQASIVFLRLMELQAFEEANVRTSLVAASLFTMRSKLPPLIIGPDMHDAYKNALDEGDRMNTKPMVELIAESVERTLSAMLARQKDARE
jgi:Fic family protein